MQFLKDFKQGVFIASHSFNMIWNNLLLLCYLGIPILFNIIINIIVYNKVVLSAENFGLQYFLYYLIYFFIIIFANCCLIKHVTMLFKNKKITIQHIVTTTFSKIKRIIAWTILSCIPMLTWHFTSLIKYKNSGLPIVFTILSLTPLIVGSIWTVLTVFALPILINEECSFASIFSRSFSILYKKLFIYSGGIFLIGVFLSFSMIFFMAIEYFAYIYFLIEISLYSNHCLHTPNIGVLLRSYTTRITILN